MHGVAAVHVIGAQDRAHTLLTFTERGRGG